MLTRVITVTIKVLLFTIILNGILICGENNNGDKENNGSDTSKKPNDTNENKREDVDVKQSFIYGPGLFPQRIVLPVHYFYIQLVDHKGKNVSSSVKFDNKLLVSIDCEGENYANRRMPVWTQILNRKDGTFIVRYKVLFSCFNKLKISILFKDKHLAKSPYLIQDPVHPDACFCPSVIASEWLILAKCSVEHNRVQIDKDLQYFPKNSVDFDLVLNQTVVKYNKYPSSHSFCHYVVKENQVFRKCYGQHVGFHIFPDAILLSLTRKVYLPNVEFIFNLGDWPLVNLQKDVNILPIFSWCKSDTSGDILVPTYELTEATLESMGRVSLDMMTVQSNSELLWKDKLPKLFWRGRDSRQERLDLIAISRKYPELINASLTNFFFFRDQMDLYGPKASHVSFFKFFDYKYQLNIDGTVAAYRFPFLLGGDSVVLKTESKYIEHFYNDLKPWVHYVPVKGNLEDLVEKIKWLLDNDEKAKKIGETGRKYAQENLMPIDIFCYYIHIFDEWALRLKNPVRIRDGMELVKQPKLQRPTNCGCKPMPKPFTPVTSTEHFGSQLDKDEL